MNTEQLKTLCDLFGPSGREDAVRAYLADCCCGMEQTVDSMGNLIVHKPGKGKKIMVAAHMDEVGFMVSQITDEGYLKFKPVGGIDPVVLYSKAVVVGPDRVPGLMTGKAVHLQEKDDRKKPIPMKDLYIEIGASSKEEAEKRVPLGSWGTFASEFVALGPHKIKAKALDDRVGCLVLLSLLEAQFDCDFYGVFTVQEEVGLRGAKIAAHQIQPDLALVLEGTTCNDVYKAPPHKQVTQCGGGVAIPVMDASAILDPALVAQLQALARQLQIPFQFKKTTAGGTDAGAIRVAAGGIPTAVLAVPCRYIHSPASVADRRDIESMEALAKAFITEQAKG